MSLLTNEQKRNAKESTTVEIQCVIVDATVLPRNTHASTTVEIQCVIVDKTLKRTARAIYNSRNSMCHC